MRLAGPAHWWQTRIAHAMFYVPQFGDLGWIAERVYVLAKAVSKCDLRSFEWFIAQLKLKSFIDHMGIHAPKVDAHV